MNDIAVLPSASSSSSRPADLGIGITFRPTTTGSTPQQRREWNRGPLQDLFPRMPAATLERALDLCIAKDVTYNLSEGRGWNARRLTAIVVAHARHAHSDYDALLRERQLERYAARRASAPAVWKVLREWCPWEESNVVLEQCFRATLLPIEERDPTWDPMDVDSDEEEADEGAGAGKADGEGDVGDPMDLDW